MALTLPMLEKLATPKPGNHVSRLPKKSAKTNAALIASLARSSLIQGEGK